MLRSTRVVCGLALLLGSLGASACGSSTEVFGNPAPDALGQGGASASSTSADATSANAASSSSSVSASSVSASSASGTASSSTSSGGGNSCAHDVCAQGEKLVPGCGDLCIDKICQTDPYCCTDKWDEVCVYRVAKSCGEQCPGDPATPSCTQLYGKTAGFSLCSESPTVCEFALNTTVGSCAFVCGNAGGQCVTAMNDAFNQTCVKSANAKLDPSSCGWSSAYSAICICTRGCGGGAPCPGGQTCEEGSCK
ncbi:MAG: hypothetical protein FJ096_01900 [Deltaproteobacteria bacterium]|nr:hypothetical protein [Deltaproteobacteria bacterium]